MARALPDDLSGARVMKKLLLICGLFAMVTRQAGAGDQLKLAVSPAHSFAPALLRIQVRIAPSVENRSLEIIADSATFYRSSEIQLEGDRSPATFNLEMKAAPEDDYRVVGILSDGTGHQRSTVYQDVTVIGPGGIGG
jgi:hypothetical protein